MKLRYIIYCMVLSLFCGFPLATSGAAQDRRGLAIPGLDGSQGLALFGGNDRLFLAVWSVSDKPAGKSSDMLCIFEKVNKQYDEVFRLEANSPGWLDLVSLGYPRLPGVILFSSNGISERGAATLIVLVDNKFQIVYKGDESEFVDFNSDGIPEILESSWPNGDGQPKTTNVYVWDGKKYKFLMKTDWQNRYGLRVQRAVAIFFNVSKAK